MPEPLGDAADGFPVPDDIHFLWENISRIQHMIRDLNNISVALKSAEATHDPQYREVNMVNAMGCVAQLRAELQRAIPYAVCPACQGRLKATCKLCRGRGAISRFLWESPAVTEGIRRIRKIRR
jgi:hypothetical protein